MLAYWRFQMELQDDLTVSPHQSEDQGPRQGTAGPVRRDGKPAKGKLGPAELLAQITHQETSAQSNVKQFRRLEEKETLGDTLGQDQAEKLARGRFAYPMTQPPSALVAVRIDESKKRNSTRRVSKKTRGGRTSSRGLLHAGNLVQAKPTVPYGPQKTTQYRPQGQFTSPAKVSILID